MKRVNNRFCFVFTFFFFLYFIYFVSGVYLYIYIIFGYLPVHHHRAGLSPNQPECTARAVTAATSNTRGFPVDDLLTPYISIYTGARVFMSVNLNFGFCCCFFSSFPCTYDYRSLNLFLASRARS